MATDDSKDTDSSFLGTGWSFPPEFLRNGQQVVMTSDEEDIRSSLEILFGTAQGERFMNPKYGLDMHELLFEPASTTMTTFLKDRIQAAILLYEPRIRLLSLEVDSLDPNAGSLQISIEYEVRATNSRYNLVYPFYKHDSSEVRGVIG
jgi:phage baseplate assembly protein W